MIEFWNVLVAWLAGLIAGLAIHSAYLHSKRHGEVRPLPWDHDEEIRRLRFGRLRILAVRLRGRRAFISALGLAAASALMTASLWQTEIATGWAQDQFTFPFFIWQVDRWWARDFWYSVNILSWFLGVLSAYLLGSELSS
jgi:hypothetical protein